jgi:hypothetical protein
MGHTWCGLPTAREQQQRGTVLYTSWPTVVACRVVEHREEGVPEQEIFEVSE